LIVTLPDDDFDIQRSQQQDGMIGPEDSALQHEPAPRPLPLFLELVREVARTEPELARDALKGLGLYAAAERRTFEAPAEAVANAGAASLRDHGGEGPPAVLIPSLINPPHILDLDREASLTGAVARMGRRALLVDWGDARNRLDLTVAGHVEQLLLPLLRGIREPAVLIGYCLGGTMALGAARLAGAQGVVTLACPWHFSRYPADGRAGLARLWQNSRVASASLGMLPIEVLQASFWSLDPRRTVSKFAELNSLDPNGPEFRRFVALEDWANQGDPLPLPAARELLEDFFGADITGRAKWAIGGQCVTEVPPCPTLHFTAARDRITPAEAAPDGTRIEIPAGHVGMVIGRARTRLHHELAHFLSACR
jgi:polyhydroxyalkanoate synthase